MPTPAKIRLNRKLENFLQWFDKIIAISQACLKYNKYCSCLAHNFYNAAKRLFHISMLGMLYLGAVSHQIVLAYCMGFWHHVLILIVRCYNSLRNGISFQFRVQPIKRACLRRPRIALFVFSEALSRLLTVSVSTEYLLYSVLCKE